MRSLARWMRLGMRAFQRCDASRPCKEEAKLAGVATCAVRAAAAPSSAGMEEEEKEPPAGACEDVDDTVDAEGLVGLASPPRVFTSARIAA